MFAEICPAGMTTDAGTVAFNASELDKEIVAAAVGADVSVTKSDPTPVEVINAVAGDRELIVGLLGVVPSVVN